MKKLLSFLILFCLLIVSCVPGQNFTPTLVPSPTNTHLPSPTNTVAPTLTPSRTITPTSSFTPTPQIQSVTPMPFPNLGKEVSDAIDDIFLSGVNFVNIPDIDGQAARRAEMPKDSTTITYIGEPYLTRAELRMDLSKLKDIDIINIYIISFLCSTTDCGLDAQDWARHSLSEAAQKGKVEKTFRESKIVIEIEDGKILNITVLPADNL